MTVMNSIACKLPSFSFMAALAALIAVFPVWAYAADGQSAAGALKFEIPVAAGADRYLELLTHPAYIAVALENIGINPSNSSRIIVRDGQTLQFRNAVVHYVERKGAVYVYEAGIEWGLGAAQAHFRLPVEVDVSAIAKGILAVRAYPPLVKLFPEEFVERIRIKVQILASPEAQRKMLDYLDGLAKKQRAQSGVYGLIEQIMIQAYNQSAAIPPGSTGREPGDAEPLADQALLLVTLLIWVVAPFALFGWRYWRNRRRRGVQG
jgi:hypothetical protein